MAHKIGRSFKKEILDDVMGIDENKTFGISNKTFVGKGLAKITPGGKNNIFGQAGDFVEDKITQPVKEGVGALGALVTGKAARDQQLADYRAQQSALEKKESESNRMALASTLLSRGKGKFFDITRPEEVEKFLIEQEGNYLDPFPDYLRKSGDYLLGGLENAGENIENYTGTSDDMMRDFQPTFDRLRGANQNAVDRLESIYDGRMENELRGFQDRSNDITRQLQDLNTQSGEMERGLQQGVLDEAQRYADALGGSVDMQTALANREFDELDRMPGLMRDQNRELASRYLDTALDELALNRELGGRYADTYGSELGAAQGDIDARYGAAGRGMGAEYGAALKNLDATYGAADRLLGAENEAADLIQRAERAKALAAGANAERMANANQRGMRSAMVGQGTGTTQNMANAMVRAELGQQRSDLLADALIRDAERRGNAGIGYAGRTGQADMNYAGMTGASDVNYAGRLGEADIGYAGRVGDAGIGRSLKMEDILDSRANLGMSQKMEGVLDTEADIAGARIGAERFSKLGDINPGLADVYRNEAMLNRANTALGFGDPRLTSQAQNLGLDQGMVDADSSIYNTIMSQQLANTGMIPGLGMQEAMLPALYGEAALASQGPLARAVSPYTATGTLPQGQTIFQSTPYSPAPAGNSKNWIDHIANLPGYIQKGRDVIGGIQDIFGGGGG